MNNSLQVSTSFKKLGQDWLVDSIEGLPDHVSDQSPVDFNEANRYLPVGSRPGMINYDINPYMREILNCFDINSPIREINLMKGVQITYTTLLESGALYYIVAVGGVPIMYLTADKELADARIDNNFMVMLNQSGYSDMIRSLDVSDNRKTGKTKKQIQFANGATLTPFGAKNADKMRQYSIQIMLKDEIDAYPQVVGKDGCPDVLTDSRCDGYSDNKKIFRGSTPLIKATSKIYHQYKRGDQRKYYILCMACSFPQFLKFAWEGEHGEKYGFAWDYESNGMLIMESARYLCKNCGHPHFNHHKEVLFSEEHGAKWKPTATPVEKTIRSYHLPSLYSPIGMKPWADIILTYLDCWDVEAKRPTDIGRYQHFYNNILAWPFEQKGSRIKPQEVYAHRRNCYTMGSVPNKWAIKHAGSRIMFLTCQVDVHLDFLAVSVMGWAIDAKCFIIDYQHLIPGDDDPRCKDLDSPVWDQVREIIEEAKFTSDDKLEYDIFLTFIDAGWGDAHDTVLSFCGEYTTGVHPIIGLPRPKLSKKIVPFVPWETRLGTHGYQIVVDHYKDRLAPVLRREWYEEAGKQPRYHFNAPLNISDKFLKELTAEIKKEMTNEKGEVWYEWDRGSRRNELWDLLIYGHAAVEIIAWNICIEQFQLKEVNWVHFWQYMNEQLTEKNKKR